MSIDIVTSAATLPPEEFVETGSRLFIDTNIFMDVDPARDGGLKGLFERCTPTIRANGNPVVVPTKVVDELAKQARIDIAGLSDERAASIKKAANALKFLDAAADTGLIRKDLGDASNPYADDLFVEVFKRAADRYDMCLLTNDITLRLRIRLLAAETDRRLVAGLLTKDGLIEVESNQALYERASRKLERKARHVSEGNGDERDLGEINTLTPLLSAFEETFRVQPVRAVPGARRAALRPAGPVVGRAEGVFIRTPKMKAPDAGLPVTTLPGEGHEVGFESARNQTGHLVLGALLGEGGEGRVYSVLDDPGIVVKVFDAEHRTVHRQAKVKLLLSRGFERKGISFPNHLITNRDGAFVGYAMPRASGDRRAQNRVPPRAPTRGR